MGELRIGLVSAATYGPSYTGSSAPRTPGSFHGTAFATTFNGFDAAAADAHAWTFVRSTRRVEGARVVKVWDPHPEWAERLAGACGIAEVADGPEACCEGVDAVIVVDDGSGSHARYAAEALRAGVPTFCDKPLGMTARAARVSADLAKATGTPFLSASSLRFVPDIVALRERIPSLGRVNLATAVCGNSLVYYGIHALSMYYAVLGGGALSCVNVGSAGRNIVRVRFADGRDLVLLVAERETMRAGYAISLFGTAGWETVRPDLSDLYSYLLEAFLEVVRTGRAPYPVDEEVEVVGVLEAGERSLSEGREVSLAEVLG